MKPKLIKDGSAYLINNILYARLSNVCSIVPPGPLRRWQKRVGEEEAARIAEETSEWGTRVHKATAYFDLRKFKLMEKVVYEDESILPALHSWQLWVKEFIVKFVAIEKIIWSEKLLVAGRIDRAGLIKGDKKLSVVDIKTGSLYPEIGVRLAGYKIMWNEREVMKSRKIERCVAVQLSRKAMGLEVKIKDYTDPTHGEDFKERCELYWQMHH